MLYDMAINKNPQTVFSVAQNHTTGQRMHTKTTTKQKKKKRIYQLQNFILKFLSGCFGLDASRPKTLAIFRRNIAFYRCVGKFTLLHCPGGVDMLTPYYYGMEQRWNKVNMVGGRAEWASPALSAYDDVVCLRQMSTYLCNKTVSFICNHIFVAEMFCLRALWHPAFAVLFPSPVERISIYVFYIMFGEFSFESLEMNGKNNKKMLLHLCALCSLYLVWPWVWNHSYAINTYGYVMYGNLLYSLIYIIHMI